jgi:pSer/pThr/pTyr-binding forkhead associated (FHA) protein
VEIKLVVIGGGYAGKEIPVRHAKFVIGRVKECQLRLGCNLVSRRHCMILVRDERIFVEDLKSTNGTFLNGSEIEGTQELNHGDRLNVGTFEFEVHLSGVVASGREREPSATSDTVARASSTTLMKGELTGRESGLDLAAMDTAAIDKTRRKPEIHHQEHADQGNAEKDLGGGAASKDEETDDLQDLQVLDAEVVLDESEPPNAGDESA